MGLCDKSFGFLACIVIVEMVAFYNSFGLCNALYHLQTNGNYIIATTEKGNSVTFKPKDLVIVKKDVLPQMTMKPVTQSIKMDPAQFPTKKLTNIPTTAPSILMTTESPNEKITFDPTTPIPGQAKEKENHVYDLILFTTEDVGNNVLFQFDG